jgi:methionyl-tRNA formyltransferase
LLPQWRSASPVQRALQAGETCLGTTLLYSVTKMDAGPIIAKKEQVIIDDDEDEDATTVLPKLVDLGTDMLLKALPDILSGKISQDTATPQDESKATKAAPLIQSIEAELKVWQETATQCHNKLRGFAMW